MSSNLLDLSNKLKHMKYTKQTKQKLKWLLIGLFIAFSLLHMVAVSIDRSAEAAWLKTLAMNFDLDREKVVPALYMSLLLAGCGLLAIFAATKEKLKRHRGVWGLLGVGFIYLAADEFFILHEQLAEPLRNLLMIGDGSLLYHAWVIPAILFVVLAMGVSVFALREHLLTGAQTGIISLVLLLTIIDVVLEALGTKLYFSQAYYRYGAIAAEELFEIGMASYILYRLYGVNVEME